MALEFQTLPSFTGTPQIGSELTAVSGVVTGGSEPYVEISAEWQEQAPGGDWVPRTTDLVTAITAEDIGKRFRFRNAWQDDAGDDVKAATDETEPVSAVFFDCIVASETATSYVCLEEAELILAGMIQSNGITGWEELSDDDKKRSLNLATSALEPLDWKGTRCSCEQKLNWPRAVNDCDCPLASCSSIPYDIKVAAAYYAAWLAANPRYGSIGGGGGSGSNSGSGGGSSGNDQVAGLEPFEQVTVGPIAVTMRKDAEFTTDGVWGWDLLDPYLKGLLSKWIDGLNGDGSVGQGRMSRGSVARVRPRLPWQVPGSLYLRNGKIYPRYSGSGRDWGNY